MRTDGAWILVGRPSATARLRGLAEAHQGQRPVMIGEDWVALSRDLDSAAAVLAVGEPGGLPSGAASLWLTAPGGSRVPIGWMPEAGARLETFARAAAEVQLRSSVSRARGPLALLAEFDARPLSLVEQVATEMPVEIRVLRWTAERIKRRSLIDALGLGLGAAVYFGHGYIDGWGGYGGFTSADAALIGGQPVGAVLSLSCHTDSRALGAFSFCEELALHGASAAVIGAADAIDHQQNVELGVAIARSLQSRSVRTVGDLLIELSASPSLLHGYRLIGDPLAALIGVPQAESRARLIYAPAPDSGLPVIPFGT